MLDTRITVVVVLPMVHVFSTQTVAEFYRRRSNANLDKSDPRVDTAGRWDNPQLGRSNKTFRAESIPKHNQSMVVPI